LSVHPPKPIVRLLSLTNHLGFVYESNAVLSDPVIEEGRRQKE
jgi:hypothetical protein